MSVMGNRTGRIGSLTTLPTQRFYSPKAARKSRDCCKLTQWGLRRSPCCKPFFAFEAHVHIKSILFAFCDTGFLSKIRG